MRALAAHGVDTVFGIPGTHNPPIYAALTRYGIAHVTTRHEQGAGYAADGYARSSGRAGVALTTTASAVNIAAAVGQSYSDSVPVLVVSPGMPLSMRRLVGETLARSAARGITPRAASRAVAEDRLAQVEARFGWYR